MYPPDSILAAMIVAQGVADCVSSHRTLPSSRNPEKNATFVRDWESGQAVTVFFFG
jgi:hypothetical protein